MAEASRGRVTITLGRSGQVVKRAGGASDVDFSGAGSKRSVRDRLGGNLDDPFLCGNQHNNKRQRGDGHTTSVNANGLNDVRIGKDDLRFKLMQKNVFRRPHGDDNEKVMDLREKLSRMGQPPLNSYEARQRMPDSRERMPDSRERMPDPRERMPEPRERMPESRERMPESRETSILGRIPSTRSADDMPHMTSSRSSYSPWTLDHLRQRSPDRVMGTSRGLSPPRNVDELQRRPMNRMYNDVRAVPFLGKDVLDAPRPVSTAPFVTKSALPPTSAKPMPPGPPIPTPIPPSSIVQKPPFSADEQQTVEGLLHSLGLGKYAILFKAEEVDMTALKQMGENDLKELGIPMGPRKKILLALLPRSKRQP